MWVDLKIRSHKVSIVRPVWDNKASFVDFGVRLVGDILVGFSSDEPSVTFTTAARDTMWTITGVDVRPLVYRSKFVFIAQIGSPQTVPSAHNMMTNRHAVTPERRRKSSEGGLQTARCLTALWHRHGGPHQRWFDESDDEFILLAVSTRAAVGMEIPMGMGVGWVWGLWWIPMGLLDLILFCTCWIMMFMHHAVQYWVHSLLWYYIQMACMTKK